MDADAVLTRRRAGVRGSPAPVWAAGRLRVDGKFFARGGKRFRVRGVTYGPFAPDPDGHPFPAPRRVRDDFAMMRDGGVNTIRTYHLPPARLLDEAAAAG